MQGEQATESMEVEGPICNSMYAFPSFTVFQRLKAHEMSEGGQV